MVFERTRSLSGRKMHALVVGVGRFPSIKSSKDPNRETCADSAKEVVSFLTRQKDHFDAPLASIGCILSDPRKAPGEDAIDSPDPSHDPRQGTNFVDSGTAKNIEQACLDWIDRCEKNDVLFLYCCSHGVAGRDERAFVVTEDYNTHKNRRSAYLLNIESLARCLPAATKASSVWIFLDACQEILDEIKDISGGVSGIQPVEANIQEIVRCDVRSVSLVSSRHGRTAHGPTSGGVAYFTEALLFGLENCCVEQVDGHWFVTSLKVDNTLSRLSRALNGNNISTERLSSPDPDHKLLRLDEPRIPVAVSSLPESLLDNANSVEIRVRSNSASILQRAPGQTSTWRFQLPLTERQLEVALTLGPNQHLVWQFDLDTPSVLLRLSK